MIFIFIIRSTLIKKLIDRSIYNFLYQLDDEKCFLDILRKTKAFQLKLTILVSITKEVRFVYIDFEF